METRASFDSESHKQQSRFLRKMKVGREVVLPHSQMEALNSEKYACEYTST